MIETLNGKSVVKCDLCGVRIYDGGRDETMEHHWCEEHTPDNLRMNPGFGGSFPVYEFRTCDYCGKPFYEGYTVEEGFWYCCEDCLETVLDNDYMVWRVNNHEDNQTWMGGYYDWYDARECVWEDTGIFYTEW